MRGLYGNVFEVFVQTERRRSEVCAKKQKDNTFPYFPEQTRLIRHLLYGFWFIFSVFSAVFVFRRRRLPYLRVCWFRFMFTLVRHSFASLINKHAASKKSNTVPGCDIVRTFPTNISSPLLFSSKSAQKFSHKNSPVRKKAYFPLTAPGEGNTLFSGSLSNQWACAVTWKQAQPYNKIYHLSEIIRVIKIPYIRQRLWVCFANGKGFLTSFCDNTYKKYNHQYLKKIHVHI